MSLLSNKSSSDNQHYSRTRSPLMRILHTIPDIGWAGREERILETALWQAEHGHKVLIAAPKDNDLHQRGAAKGMSIVDLPIRPTTTVIENLCHVHEADIIDSHGTRDTVASAHARLSIPVVHTRHCLLRDEDITAQQRITWNRLDHVIAVAGAIRNELIDNGVVNSHRISVVDEWVLPQFFELPDISLVEKACLELGINRDHPVIALIAMLRQEKGIEVLLQAAVQARLHIPDLQILIAGGTSASSGLNCPALKVIQSLLRNLKLSNCVITTGFREDINVLMHGADLLIVPSLREAQSRVIPQAFASGLPVIASDIGGIPELIKDGITGWLVPSNSPITLAARIIASLNESALRADIADRARQFAQEALDLESKMHKTIAVYELARQQRANSTANLRSTSTHRQPASTNSLNPLVGRHVMVIVAHPDDETIGAGACLSEASRLTLVHVTDGAESDERAIAKGFTCRADYARARKEELDRALAIAGIDVTCIDLGLRDQCAALQMADITAVLKELMLSITPDVILTHAFEGGHPDHDATAFAVHNAHQKLNSFRPPLYEMTGYHNVNGEPVYGAFIPRSDSEQITYTLSPPLLVKKQEMLSAFKSQRNIITCFPLVSESFRPAPVYDFRARPHDGPLYYERYKFNTDWTDWTILVQRASDQLSANGRRSFSRPRFISDLFVKLKNIISAVQQSAELATDNVLDNAPMDKSMTAILDRLIDKISQAPVDSVPSDNIYIEELFEPSIFAEILQRLPGDADYEYIVHPDATLPDGRVTRKLLPLTNDTINRLAPVNRRFWRRMKSILTSERLLQAILRKFSAAIEARFGKSYPRMLLSPVLYRDYPGYRISIHPDVPGKIATLQFYLPTDDAQIHLGTTFHVKRGHHFYEHKTNLFKPNSAYAFVRTNSSWHSVKELSQHEQVRNTLALTVYVEEQHFRSEGRRPEVVHRSLHPDREIQRQRHSHLRTIFNRAWTLIFKANFDVVFPNKKLLEHNTNEGVNEALDETALDKTALFDSLWYLAKYTDVAKSGMNPLTHFLRHGAYEGRDPNPLFDSKWYLTQYQDVAASGMNPLIHYLRHGAYEGRDPNPLFDSKWYLAQYPDVAASAINPLVHYLHHGAYEERDPNPLFDSKWYLARYPDVAASGVNPLVHYLHHGANEERDPNPQFSVKLYLTQCPEASAAGINPLVHYIQNGQYQAWLANLQQQKLFYSVSFD